MEINHSEVTQPNLKIKNIVILRETQRDSEN